MGLNLFRRRRDSWVKQPGRVYKVRAALNRIGEDAMKSNKKTTALAATALGAAMLLSPALGRAPAAAFHKLRKDRERLSASALQRRQQHRAAARLHDRNDLRRHQDRNFVERRRDRALAERRRNCAQPRRHGRRVPARPEGAVKERRSRADSRHGGGLAERHGAPDDQRPGRGARPGARRQSSLAGRSGEAAEQDHGSAGRQGRERGAAQLLERREEIASFACESAAILRGARKNFPDDGAAG